MSRLYLVSDANGEHRFEEAKLPLSVGGADADIVVPGCRAGQIVAYIALAEGHAYIQPADPALKLFHNFEHLTASAWLKSGDQVQLGEASLLWTVKGDQVFITVRETGGKPADAVLQPPTTPPVQPAGPLPLRPPATSGSGSHRRLKQVAAVLFVLLLMAAGFVLVATPVSVQVEPPPASQAIKGFPPPLPLAGRQLLWPGRYRVEARLEGYRPLDEIIDVPMGGYRDYRFTLTELPGRVTIRVTPDAPFVLRVDGEPVDVDADGVALLARGNHRVRVESRRYLPAEQTVEVTGRGRQQELVFTLQPAWAGVRIGSRPPGAAVRVDGERLGTTPLETELLQGTREITLELPLYKRVTLQQAIVAGQSLDLGDIELQPADGELVLESEPGEATVQIDGRFRGTTPLTLALSSGDTHQLKLTKAGYAPLERELRVEPEQQLQLRLTLARQYGTLFINADPPDARLRVDGKVVGLATRRLRLSTRAHRIEVFRPGYASYTTTVTPRAGVSRTLEVKLKTEQQAREAATPKTLETVAGPLHLVRPGAPFTMGASRREAGRRANESRRRVVLTRAFYFGEKEVTNAAFRQFRASHRSGRAEGVALDGPEQPVVNVSWDDAARFCNWLSQREGLPPAYREVDGGMRLIRPVTTGYRLPTEAEWAYVARALGRDKPARYPWNGTFPPTQVVGNFADARISDTLAEVIPGYDDRYRASAPVGHFAAFPPGFYDLGGNVAEWVNDYYGVYPGEAGKTVRDPLGPEQGEHHVVRGSSWRHGNITELRLSYRDYSRKPRDDLGFRVARYVQ